MKRKTKILGTLVLLSCVAVSWPVVAHYRLKAQLAAYQRQLQAHGEKLTIEALAPPYSSEAVWSANALMAAANRLRSVAPNFSNQPPLMHIVAPGRALVAWRQESLPTSEMTNVWPGLSNDLALAQPLLAQARAAVHSPRLDFALDYSQGYSLLLPHLAVFKGAAQWFSADAAFALHEHRLADACESLQAQLALVQHHKDEPIVISVLVRIAIGSIAASTTWETLQAPGLQDAQLQALQEAWSSIDVLPQTEASLGMERVTTSQLFAQGRTSYAAIARAMSGAGFSFSSGSSGLSELAQLGKQVLDDPKEGLKKLGRRYTGYWRWKYWQSYDDELAGDQSTQAGLDAMRTAGRQGMFGPALATFEQATNTIMQAHPKAGLWLEYSPGSFLRGYFGRVASFEVQRALVTTAIALQRYQLRHGSYPAQLSALAPEFLPATPRDPIDGKPLRYRLNPDGVFLLYSVGADSVDDGGDPKPWPNPAGAKGWTQGRDVVWPTPASAAETQEYFETLAAKRQGQGHNLDAALRARYGLPPQPTAPGTNPPSK